MEDARPARPDVQKKTSRAAEQARPDIAQARSAWREHQHELSFEHLVFIDETWATTNMARLCGRGPRGARVEGLLPHGHWHTTTFLAGLRADGIIAPFVIGQAMNGLIFRAYVEQVLAPELRVHDIVVMDNLASHKVEGIGRAIEARGAGVLYLPPYSPDLNPIEQLFAKLKALLRAAAERSVEALWAAIGRLLDRFTPTECANYLANAGYRQSA